MGSDPLGRDAFAKVNLTLEVLWKRPSGFHEIRSVMQSISLCDRVTVSAASDLRVTCSRPELAGEQNLAFTAARLLQQVTGSAQGAAVHVEKRIPVAAGLGGGSSDAAATLLLLNALWGTHLSPSDLHSLAAQLGSDVPFFLLGGTALARGRGEVVEPLPDLAPRWLVLAAPPSALSTAAVYGAVQPADWSDGTHTDRLAAMLPGAADDDLPLLPLWNDLEPVARRLCPPIGEILALLGGPAHHALMSGSGPSVFAVADSLADAERRCARLVAAGWPAEVVRTVSRRHAPGGEPTPHPSPEQALR